jgi:hypothetical protein
MAKLFNLGAFFCDVKRIDLAIWDSNVVVPRCPMMNVEEGRTRRDVEDKGKTPKTAPVLPLKNRLPLIFTPSTTNTNHPRTFACDLQRSKYCLMKIEVPIR